MGKPKEKFNLGYRFGGDLREVPENPASMQAYVDFLNHELKQLSDPPLNAQVRGVVKLLGEVGAYARILGKAEMATRALERSLRLIEDHHLEARTWAVHTLRYGEALRVRGDEFDAEVAFRSVLEMARRSKEVAELEDFAWQHLGKLRFDQRSYEEAKTCFLEALQIRKRQGVKELIESTELALRVLQMKTGR